MATYRKLPKGNIQAIVRVTGHKPRYRTFRKKSLAERWAIKTEDALKLDEAPPEDVPTVSEAIDKYMAEISPLMADSSESTRKYIAKMFKGIFGGLLVTELSPQELLQKYTHPRLECVSPDTVRRELSFLSQLFQHTNHKNPVPELRSDLFRLRKLSPPTPRSRRLSPTEEHLLSSFCSYTLDTVYMYWVILLILSTGLDRAEVTLLKKDLIGNKKYKLPRTKNSSSQSLNRIIILKKPQRNMIRQLALLSSHPTLLVPYRPDSLTQCFSRLCKKLGINNLTLKDLRGEFAHRLVEKNVPIEIVASLLGDSISTCMKHYVNNIDTDHIRRMLP